VACLSERAHTLFLFSEGDAGITFFAEAFGRKQVPPGVTVKIIPDLDHSLTTREMRRIVAEHLIESVKQELDRAYTLLQGVADGR
jgi:hypothetical protein